MTTIKFEKCFSSELNERYSHLPDVKPDRHRVIVTKKSLTESGQEFDKIVFVAEAKSKKTLISHLKKNGYQV